MRIPAFAGTTILHRVQAAYPVGSPAGERLLDMRAAMPDEFPIPLFGRREVAMLEIMT
jgi:hypothetical protein